MVTKKLITRLIVVVLILVVVLGNTQLCFADNFSLNFDRLVKNDNVKNVTLSNDNQNAALNSLYDNGYRSVISRYSQRLIHVCYNFIGYGAQLGVYYNHTNGNFSQFCDYINSNVVLSVNNSSGHNLNAINIDYSQLTMNQTFFNQGSKYAVRFDISGILEFDMPLINTQLINSNNASELFYSNLLISLGDTKFNVGNSVYTCIRTELQESHQFNYLVKYTLSEPLYNVDYIYLFNEISTESTDNNFNENYNFGSNRYKSYYNGVSTYYNVDGVLSRCSLLYELLDNSKFMSAEYGFDYVPTSDYQGYNYTFNDYDTLYNSIVTFTPLFANNNTNFIQSDSSNNVTPFNLHYYDCQWYEIHYQIANAFIFMLTEFPFLSDITNLIYSLFVMIKTSFEVLLNFDGFGILFGAGMFAVVFGFILKFLIGD